MAVQIELFDAPADVTNLTDERLDTVQSIREGGPAQPAVEAASRRLALLGLLPARGHRPPTTGRTLLVLAALIALGISLVMMSGSLAKIPWSHLIAPIIFVLFLIVALPGHSHVARLLWGSSPAHKALNEARSAHQRPRVGRKASALGHLHSLCPLIALHGEMILWDFDPVLAMALSFPRSRDSGFWEFLSDLDFGDCDGCGG